MADPALQVLLDKQEIAELLTRYLRSVDRGDVDTLRACYLPGATEDHGGTGTTMPPRKSTGCGACSPPTRRFCA